jgi:hypothetical protein
MGAGVPGEVAAGFIRMTGRKRSPGGIHGERFRQLADHSYYFNP